MKCLTTREQDRLVRQHWPSFSTLKQSRSLAAWEGTLRPLCKTYRIQVMLQRPDKLAENCLPLVVVLDPLLRRRPSAPEQPIPHIYLNPNPRCQDFPVLCLYYPPRGEWHGGKAVGKTIIPWTSEWLICYEGWLATGEWMGGGIHP